MRLLRRREVSPLDADHVPDRSDILVEKLEANGGVVLAKSNAPEFGAARNPWNSGLTRGVGEDGGAGSAGAGRGLRRCVVVLVLFANGPVIVAVQDNRKRCLPRP